MSYQNTSIIGNLGRDPELSYTQSGRAVCNFSVAVTETWKDKSGNKQEKTTWFKVATWGPLAETCNTYLKKGRQVFVEGAVSVEAYTTRAGEPGASLVLTAKNVRFLGGNRGESGAPSVDPEYFADDDINGDAVSDIPF